MNRYDEFWAKVEEKRNHDSAELYALLISICLTLMVGLLMLAATAEAQSTVRIHLVHVLGPQTATKQQALTVWADAQRLMAKAGLTATLARYTRTPDRRPDLHTLSTRSAQLSYFRSFAKRRRWDRGVDAVHFLTRPFAENGAMYFAGVASGICVPHRPYSTSNAGAVNASGEGRLVHSGVALAHELLHLFGAFHVEAPPNVMHPAALGSLPDALTVLQRTRGEVRFCVSCKSDSCEG